MFKNRSLISIADLSKEEILYLLKRTKEFKIDRQVKNSLQGKILASCFFEPSTRTRLSFETAMLKTGGQVIGFSDEQTTAVQKGETLTDSIRVIGGYADLIVIRHPLEGAARLASLATPIPVINAGDGSNQHPTQTLIDLFSIEETQGRLSDLKIALVGDLKYARVAKSLALGCSHFDIQLYFVSPPGLSLPTRLCHCLRKRGVKFSFHSSIEEVISKVDILYLTRIQKERQAKEEYELNHPLFFNSALLEKAKPNLKILHALPRVAQMDLAVDKTPFAYYFEQSTNGIFLRSALLSEILNP